MISDNDRDNKVVTIDIMPGNIEAEIKKAIQMRDVLNKLFNDLLQQGIDFDRISGTDKPTLLKPGADLLCQVFRLAPGKPEIIKCIEDFEKGIFSYTISLQILHRDTGGLVSTGIGSANSQEIKYKYRNADQGGKKVKIVNPEPADQQNTLVKMAAKRAYIDGVIKATGASRMFMEDAENMSWLAPEKASSKQISYLKTLFKGMKTEDIFVEIEDILGRIPDGWEDITRDEATKIIEVKKKEAGKRKNPETTDSMEYVCTNCQVKITQAVATYSDRKFGKHLCVKCQGEEELNS